MNPLAPSARRALDFEEAQANPPLDDLTPPEARDDYLQSFADSQKPLEDVAEISERQLGDLRLKLWRGIGAPDADAPVLLYLHGGGWVIGAPETHEDNCRWLANRAGALVVAPDYRLAPECPFPAAIDDCAEALRYVAREAPALGIDPGRIAIGGDSAGGNLAAVLALMSRDGIVPDVIAQLLIYPVTDCRQYWDSYARYSDGFGLTAAGMKWFRDHYLPDKGQATDWRASPLLTASLAGVAPAFVALAECDVLHDEGAAYAQRLEAEAQVIRHTWPGQIHGFVSMRGFIPEGDEALEHLLRAWQQFDAGFRANG